MTLATSLPDYLHMDDPTSNLAGLGAAARPVPIAPHPAVVAVAPKNLPFPSQDYVIAQVIGGDGAPTKISRIKNRSYKRAKQEFRKFNKEMKKIQKQPGQHRDVYEDSVTYMAQGGRVLAVRPGFIDMERVQSWGSRQGWPLAGLGEAPLPTWPVGPMYYAADGTVIGRGNACDPITDEPDLSGIYDYSRALVPDVLSENRIDWGQDFAVPLMIGSIKYLQNGSALNAALWALTGYIFPYGVAALVAYNSYRGYKQFGPAVYTGDF